MRQMTAIQARERLSEDSNKTGESTILKNHVSQWAESTGLSPSQDREFSSASCLHGSVLSSQLSWSCCRS